MFWRWHNHNPPLSQQKTNGKWKKIMNLHNISQHPGANLIPIIPSEILSTLPFLAADAKSSAACVSFASAIRKQLIALRDPEMKGKYMKKIYEKEILEAWRFH